MVLCLLWEVSLGLKILLWVLLKSQVSGAWPVALVSLAMGPRGNFSVPDTCQLAGAAADFGGIPWAGKQVPVAAPDGLSGRCCLVLGCLGSEDHEPLHATLVIVPSLPELNPTSSYYEKSSPHSFKNLNDRVNCYMYQLNQPFQWQVDIWFSTPKGQYIPYYTTVIFPNKLPGWHLASEVERQIVNKEDKPVFFLFMLHFHYA